MLLSSSLSASGFRVLLLFLKHTTVNTATITSTMRTIVIGSTAANTVELAEVSVPGEKKKGKHVRML